MYEHRKEGAIKRLLLSLRQVREVMTPGMQGPCGHEVQGDSSSWWCPTCGGSGGSS